MGECLISRRGGEAYKLPILDTNYPQDVTVMATPDGTASFSIAIAEHGKPTNYTYQWYVNGEAVSGAINANYTKNTTSNDIGTYTVYCDITSKAGTISSRVATLVVKSAIPTSASYSYSGTSELKKDSDYDWTLYLKSSGTLALTDTYDVDIFLQAGGGGGGEGALASGDSFYHGGGGGAGGYQHTEYAQTITGSYDITIGAGGAVKGNGGTTSAFGFCAEGGSSGSGSSGGKSGTASGGSGGYYGGNGVGGNGANGSQGKQAFGAGDIYYGAGGGGTAASFGSSNGNGGETGGGAGTKSATANTGSGGGGDTGKGGSGIVIIRNAR